MEAAAAQEGVGAVSGLQPFPKVDSLRGTLTALGAPALTPGSAGIETLARQTCFRGEGGAGPAEHCGRSLLPSCPLSPCLRPPPSMTGRGPRCFATGFGC